MGKIQSFTMLVLMLSVANAWGAGFRDDFNRPNGDLGNDWATQTNGTIEVKIVDNEVLIEGQQATDWTRSGLSRAVEDETRISFDFKADDNFNVHIRIDDASTSGYIDVYAWPGGPFSYASSEDGSWPGWTEISGSGMIPGEYNTLMLEQEYTEFIVTLNGTVVGTVTNENLPNIGSVLISCDSAADTSGSLHIDNVQIGVVNAEIAKDPIPEDGALHPDTWVSLVWKPGDFALSHDVYFGDNFDDVNDGTGDTFRGNQASANYIVGFPGFAFPEGLVPGTTYYWRIDEVNELDPNSPWKGPVWSFSIPPKTAYAPNPADAAEQVDPDVTLRWTEGFGSKLHTVYFGDNFDDVNDAAGGLPQGVTTYDPGTLKLAHTYYWRVDEFDIIETYKGHVWSFTTQGAVGSPNPANGAVDVKRTQIITFSPSIFAASHQLYFGTDKDAVKNADTGSPEYKGTRDLGSESYDPGKLELGVTYYWRVDEVNDVNPDSPWPGILWSFTTANFLVVDDFEDYDSGDNQIWYAWHDGLGYAAYGNEPAYPGNGTGSAVGDESTDSFTEETIVYGGNQSMPFWYDNSILLYSEVEKTLTYPRDWTEEGVGVLSIWFRGNSDNAAEPMYVALNGSAVVTHENPNAAQINKWTRWTIDLQAFADQGVNLANVNTIAIGFGDKKNPVAGGSGIMYFDDIRLYRPAETAP
ncbi:MAG: hypothetical protein ACETWQ_11375 [Phycisphaerae bacterium]